MQDGRAVHFEDLRYWRDAVAAELEAPCPHRLVASAGTLPDAYAVLGRMASGEVDANVVIVDGVLADGSLADDSRPGADAWRIVQRVRELQLSVRIIGLFVIDLRDSAGVDASLSKFSLNRGDLARAIDRLPEPQSQPLQS